MKRTILLVTNLLLAATTVVASATVQSLYQFQDGTWLENIASLSNGTLLLTSVTSNILYAFNPAAPSAQPSKIYEFSNATGALGISEVYPNVFAVVTGDIDLSTHLGIKGTLCLWTVEVKNHQTNGRKVVCIPDSVLLNGLTTFAPGVVFVADSHAGLIYRVDLRTGHFVVFSQDPLLSPVPNSLVGIGVNGVRVHKDTLYFTNTDQGILGTIPLSSTGQPKGPVKSIANTSSVPNVTLWDDFSVDEDGTAWVATNPDAIVRVAKNGKAELVVGNGSGIIGPTATAFKRGGHKGDKFQKVLYVTSSGTGSAGGQIVAIQLS